MHHTLILTVMEEVFTALLLLDKSVCIGKVFVYKWAYSKGP